MVRPCLLALGLLALARAAARAEDPSAAAEVMAETLDTRPGWDLEWHESPDRAAAATVDGAASGGLGDATATVFAGRSVYTASGFSLGAGLQYTRLQLDAAPGIPLPRYFQSEGVGVGAVWQPAASWGGTVQVLPAFSGQSARADGRTFNVTGTGEGLWLPSPDVLVEAGLQFDTLGKYPVYPCGGAVFALTSNLSARLLFPQPRCVYAFTAVWSAYLGADVEVQSYRSDSDFGARRGLPRLDHAAFTFEETQWGPGVTAKIRDAVTIDVGAGFVVDRHFDFFRGEIAIAAKPAAAARASVVALF